MSISEWIENREMKAFPTLSYQEVRETFPTLAIKTVSNELHRLCRTKRIQPVQYLKQKYLAKDEAIVLFRKYIQNHIERYKYVDIESYLKEVYFLQLQLAGKSQSVIIEMMGEIIRKDYGFNIDDYNDYLKKRFIYFDDVLITGGTLFKDLLGWPSEDWNNKLNEHKISLEIDLIVEHRFGYEMMKFRLTKEVPKFNVSNINIWYYYEVENQIKFAGQN